MCSRPMYGDNMNTVYIMNRCCVAGLCMERTRIQCVLRADVV